MSALAANPNNPVVFFDVTIGGQVRGAGTGSGQNWGCRSVVGLRERGALGCGARRVTAGPGGHWAPRERLQGTGAGLVGTGISAGE